MFHDGVPERSVTPTGSCPIKIYNEKAEPTVRIGLTRPQMNHSATGLILNRSRAL